MIDPASNTVYLASHAVELGNHRGYLSSHVENLASHSPNLDSTLPNHASHTVHLFGHSICLASHRHNLVWGEVILPQGTQGFTASKPSITDIIQALHLTWRKQDHTETLIFIDGVYSVCLLFLLTCVACGRYCSDIIQDNLTYPGNVTSHYI